MISDERTVTFQNAVNGKKINKWNTAITTVRKDLISKDSKQWKKYVWCLSDNLLKYQEINSDISKVKITSSAKHTLVVHKKMYILFMLLHAW